MKSRLTTMRGISLLEGLVAVVVLAIGLLALFRFQAEVLRSGTDAKTRTEALQVAEARLGELRDIASRNAQFILDTTATAQEFREYLQDRADELDARDEGAEDLALRFGQGWQINTVVCDPADLTTCPGGVVPTNYPATVMVTLAWTGAGTPPDENDRCPEDVAGNEQQCVTTAAIISLKDPVAGIVLAKTDDSSGGGFVPAPSGDAIYGKPGETNDALASYSPLPEYDGEPPKGSIYGDRGDGVVLVRTDLGEYQLVSTLPDSANQIIIKSGTPIAVISGTVYATPDVPFDRDWIKVGAPDVSFCTTAIDPNDQPNESFTFFRYAVQDAEGDLVYDALPYNCYVGTGWYGAIGPLVFDPDNPSLELLKPQDQEYKLSDRVCLGEDGILDSGFSNSRHPQLSYIRTYRGYSPLTIDGEAAVDGENDPIYSSSGITHVVSEDDGKTITLLFGRSKHDFLLDTIHNATDGDCLPPLLAGESAVELVGIEVDPEDLAGMVPVTFSTPWLCGQGNPNCPDGGNPGEFYCLTESCPTPLPSAGEAVDTVTYEIRGEFLKQVGDLTVAVPGGTVTTSDGRSCDVDEYGTYSCLVFAMCMDDGCSPWEGTITATAPPEHTIAMTDGGPQRPLEVSADVEQNFWVEAYASTPRTIGGSVTLFGGATYGGVASDSAGSCWVTRDNNLAILGPFGCDYNDLPVGSNVVLTVATGNVLCASSGTVEVTSVVDPSAKTITLTGINGNLANVKIDIGVKKSDCPKK